MDIVVCIKRVPTTDTTIKIAGDGKSIDKTGVSFELNAYDEFALEQALRIKEQVGGGSVTVVTIGSKDAQKELLDALARGADKAVLLTTDEWMFDGAQTAAVLGRRTDAAEAKVREILSNGGEAFPLIADLLDEDALRDDRDRLLAE
jgi:electron transfer flavoprotein beta subunit